MTPPSIHKLKPKPQDSSLTLLFPFLPSIYNTSVKSVDSVCCQHHYRCHSGLSHHRLCPHCPPCFLSGIHSLVTTQMPEGCFKTQAERVHHLLKTLQWFLVTPRIKPKTSSRSLRHPTTRSLPPFLPSPPLVILHSSHITHEQTELPLVFGPSY